MNLDELAELARKATPGPWGVVASINCGDVYVKHGNGAHTLADSERNAALIAACSPETILALVRVAKAAEAYMDREHDKNRGELQDALRDMSRA